MIQRLKSEEIDRIVADLPGHVCDLLLNDSDACMYLAGGFIRDHVVGDAPKDIDIFGSDAEHLLGQADRLASVTGGHCRATSNAATVRWRVSGGPLSEGHVDDDAVTVQFITRWLFDDPSKLIESFDFSVCQAAIWWDCGAWRDVCSDRFREDAESRRLFYTAPDREEDCGHSMVRAFKMARRGYSVSGPEIAKITARLMKGVDQGTLDMFEFSDEGHIADLLEPFLITSRGY